MNKEGNEKKNKYSNSSLLIMGGLLLVVVVGIIVANLILKGNGSDSFFAKLATNGNVKVNYNYNLFTASGYDTNLITGYNPTLQTLVFKGTMNGNSTTLGNLNNVKLKAGEKYSLYVKYIGGSYDVKKSANPQVILELQKDGNSYSGKKNGKHYIYVNLPLTSTKSFEKTITITNENIDANSFNFSLETKLENGITFNNYRIQIFVTKVSTSQKIMNKEYGSMPVPEKYGYEFLGWYDSLSGNNKITSSTKLTKNYNHTLYAHWKSKAGLTSENCKEGYILENGNCVAQCNLSGCETCLFPNVCSKCKEGYSLNNGNCIQNSKCSISNCLECGSEGQCLKCKIGYQLKDGQCNFNSCPDGYSLKNGQCLINCNITNCKTCKEANICSVCFNGYKLEKGACVKETATPTICNIDNCSTCSLGKCTKCKEGYTLSNGKCIVNINCNVTNCAICTSNNKCSKCNAGYILQNNSCIKATNNGSCTCLTGTYSGTCLRYYDSSAECTANCDTECGVLKNAKENKTSYYCKKQVVDATHSTCKDELGAEYSGTLARNYKTLSCGSYTSCTDVCKALGYTVRSGSCSLNTIR